MGLQAPETWLVRGRSLIGLGEYAAGEAALREAIARRPGFADAHADLAQLIWMRSEDIEAATAELDTALQQFPGDPDLAMAKAKLLEYAGDLEGAYAALGPALAARASDPRLHVTAALLSLTVDAERALAHAQRGFDLSPDLGPTGAALAQANLAVGRADIAASLAEDLRRDWPVDQLPVTLLATAWRILGDPRYLELADYDRLVRQTLLETPAGWSSLEDYLGDLGASLHALQTLKGHPVGQSLRHGAQTTQNLSLSEDPVIRAFFAAIDAPIREYIDILAERDDVLGARVNGGYRFSGAWSALLRPGGHHVNHIHPMGWISSAFHVETPAAIEQGRQGWLKFGEPGLATTPVLGPEHFVKPRAGALALFPSCMWHGTVPFGGSAPRLTIAFDLIPE
jgi:tetratricopeptide (TPR) repeat protein